MVEVNVNVAPQHEAESFNTLIHLCGRLSFALKRGGFFYKGLLVGFSSGGLAVAGNKVDKRMQRETGIPVIPFILGAGR
jgi:cysteine synthase